MSLPADAARMRAQVHARINQRNRSSESPAAQTASTRAAVNRSNARRSTGPTSQNGKSVSSLNALKTGLTGRTVLLHSDDLAQYQQHLRDYQAEYGPHGLREREPVQSLADTQWRLSRIPGLEMSLYLAGRVHVENSSSSPGSTTPLDANLGDFHAFLTFEKELRNLHLQEARLLRRYEKEQKELRALQAAREQKAVEKAPEQNAAPPVPAPAETAGFEFSKPPKAMSAVTSPTHESAPNRTVPHKIPDSPAFSPPRRP